MTDNANTNTIIPLQQATLSLLAEQLGGKVKLPQYDRSAITPGIVHFGVGGFHRAHQAYYLHRLMNVGQSRDWGIVGAGILPGDRAMRDALQTQDCLYTLVAKNADGSWDTEIVGSIIEYMYGPDAPQALVEKLADPRIRIVSLTITEGGYNLDQTTGDFLLNTPEVQADLQPGALPGTVFGYIYEGLKCRKERGMAPFTVMSCDNILDNGAAARRAILTFAREKDAEIAAWIEKNVRFPSCMVDRITPRTEPKDIEAVCAQYGYRDNWPVVTEPFIQWVLTDDFNSGRPAYDAAGVQMVKDVEPYELMKLRLLNASHQGLAYFGWLGGFRLVHDAVQNDLIAKFLLKFMDEEATPTLEPVPGIDLDAYKQSLIARFSNAEVRDTVARLAAETSDRIPKWFVPMIQKQLANGGKVLCLAAIVASWARYAEGVDEQGAPIEVVDNIKEQVCAAAARNKEDALAFLRQESLFGDLAEQERFADAYARVLASLHGVGAMETLRRILADELA